MSTASGHECICGPLLIASDLINLPSVSLMRDKHGSYFLYVSINSTEVESLQQKTKSDKVRQDLFLRCSPVSIPILMRREESNLQSQGYLIGLSNPRASHVTVTPPRSGYINIARLLSFLKKNFRNFQKFSVAENRHKNDYRSGDRQHKQTFPSLKHLLPLMRGQELHLQSQGYLIGLSNPRASHVTVTPPRSG